MRLRIIELARKTRGTVSRDELTTGEGTPSRSAYRNFEDAVSWPRHATMQKIESLLGWCPGAVEEALASGPAPRKVILSMMRSDKPEEEAAPAATQSVDVPTTPAPAPTQAGAALTTPAPPAQPARQDEAGLAGFSDLELARELARRALERELTPGS